MRKVGIVIGIIIIVIVVAIGIFASTFDINRYHAQIQSELANQLGRNVSLGQMHLNLFPPRFEVYNVSIADDPKFNTTRPFVQTQELDVAVKLLPLLHKSVEIDSLYLQRPAVELIKNSRGTWNFASLGKSSSNAPAAEPSNPAPPEQPKSSSQEQFSLSKLVIQDGQVAATDEQAKQPRSVYDHIDVTLRDFAPNQPFTIDAAAHLPGPNNQLISLAGKGGPVRQDQPAATPFHGTLNLQRVQISDARQFLKSPALEKLDGSISGQTKISSDGGKLAAEGGLNIDNVRMNGHDLGYPISLQYNAADDVPADLLTIHSANIKLGTTPIAINGTVNSKSTPAQIDLSAKANGVSVAEAAKLAATAGVALTPGADVTGTVDLNVQARGAVDNPSLNGNIGAHNIAVSGKDFPQPVQINSVALSLSPTEIHSNPFNVTSGGTMMNVQFALRQYLSKSPTVDATLRAPDAQLPGLLAMAKAYGVSSMDKVSGAGTLNLDLHASGPVRSVSSADLARSLNGTAALNFHDVHYSGADISHELTSIAGALGLHESNQGGTTINKLTGNIAVKNGIAQTNNMQALLDIGNVGIAGTANLVDQALNLRVTAVLSKELSQQAGGTSIGGYAKTALDNSQGELVIPATVTGTFDHPKFAPDIQQLAQMKLKGLMPDFNNPTAAASSILGKFFNGQGANGAQSQNPAASPTPSASPNPLQQLQGLFGKKKQPQSK
ncbi:MAG TPA: AsmA family protein [Bryobacteraceae bacterium]|nr:AsmA family protein [Bryobacteraceae bacterium]